MDEYFIEICKQSKSDEVDFRDDGGWREYQDKKEREQQKEKKKPQPVVHSTLFLQYRSFLLTFCRVLLVKTTSLNSM